MLLLGLNPNPSVTPAPIFYCDLIKLKNYICSLDPKQTYQIKWNLKNICLSLLFCRCGSTTKGRWPMLEEATAQALWKYASVPDSSRLSVQDRTAPSLYGSSPTCLGQVSSQELSRNREQIETVTLKNQQKVQNYFEVVNHSTKHEKLLDYFVFKKTKQILVFIRKAIFHIYINVTTYIYTHLFFSLIKVTHWVIWYVLFCLWDDAYKRTCAANRKE